MVPLNGKIAEVHSIIKVNGKNKSLRVFFPNIDNIIPESVIGNDTSFRMSVDNSCPVMSTIKPKPVKHPPNIEDPF